MPALPSQSFVIRYFAPQNNSSYFWTGKFDPKGDPIFTINIDKGQKFAEEKFAQNVLDEFDIKKEWKIEELR